MRWHYYTWHSVWFYNASKPISRTQSIQYLSDHFLSFPRPNLKRQRPTSVLWFASTRTPPTISQGDLPYEVITFMNFIPSWMPIFTVLRPRTNFSLVGSWQQDDLTFEINWKSFHQDEQVWPTSRDGDGASYASFRLQGTRPERDTLQVVIGNQGWCCFGRS